MRKLLTVLALPWAVWPGTPAADDVVAPVVVVTAPGLAAASTSSASRPLQVIDRDWIQAHPGLDLPGVLARAAGIQVRRGGGPGAVVDLRGQGDTASSNVLVLVDGTRLNGPDFSGPDLSSIPVERIQRIEIQRGSAAVAHGDGAVGGVIHIRTREYGDDDTRATAHVGAGSFGSAEVAMGLGFARGRGTTHLDGDWFTRDGAQDNAGRRRSRVAIKQGWEADAATLVTLDLSHHRDRHGLPGPVDAADVEDEAARRRSLRPADHGATDESRMVLALDRDLDSGGMLTVRQGGRWRDNEFILGYSPLVPESQQKGSIHERSTHGALTWQPGGGVHQDHVLTLGLDWRLTGYQRWERAAARRENSRLTGMGAFVLDQWTPLPDWTLQAGLRGQWTRAQVRSDRWPLGSDGQRRWVNGPLTAHLWQDWALDLGAVHALSAHWQLYGSLATSFRHPNVDELALAEGVLTPQNAWHGEVGGRWQRGAWQSSLGLSGQWTRDELYYGEDPLTGVSYNRNHQHLTRRLALEWAISGAVRRDLQLHASQEWTHARLGDDVPLPLVSPWVTRAGVTWSPSENWSLNLDGRHEASRPDGNDLGGGRYPRVAGFLTLDLGLTWTMDLWRLQARMDNLTGSRYATACYSASCYPEPTRAFWLGVERSF
ncbi:MAG: TonB-dependent receptor [Magnetococcus sp. WYHC-3]